MTIELEVYECGICGCVHPWSWDGDCRDDDNRFGGVDDYAQRMNVQVDLIDVHSMDERVAADVED